MKIVPYVVYFFMISIVAAQDVSSVVDAWRDQNNNLLGTLGTLGDKLKEQYPDERNRLLSVYQWVINSEDRFRTENGMIAKELWREIASPTVGAQVLSNLIRNAETSAELKILNVYLETDVLDIIKYNSASRDEIDTAYGSRKEEYYDVSSYAAVSASRTLRLDIMLMSIAPASALLNLDGEKYVIGVEDLVSETQSLRFDFELKREPKQMEQIEANLVQLSKLDDEWIDTYIAKVISWGRRINPSFVFQPSLLDYLQAKSSMTINYFLNFKSLDDLLSEKWSKSSRFANTESLESIENQLNASSSDAKVVSKGLGDIDAVSGEPLSSDGDNRFVFIVIIIICSCGIAICAYLLRRK
jgi:hypothetical protein